MIKESLNNKQLILNTFGLATRARKVCFGYDTTILAIQSKKAKLVIVANDCSNQTKERFINKCEYYKIPIDFSFTSMEITQSIGKNSSKIIAILDDGFSEKIKKLLKEGVKYEG